MLPASERCQTRSGPLLVKASITAVRPTLNVAPAHDDDQGVHRQHGCMAVGLKHVLESCCGRTLFLFLQIHRAGARAADLPVNLAELDTSYAHIKVLPACSSIPRVRSILLANPGMLGLECSDRQNHRQWPQRELAVGRLTWDSSPPVVAELTPIDRHLPETARPLVQCSRRLGRGWAMEDAKRLSARRCRGSGRSSPKHDPLTVQT